MTDLWGNKRKRRRHDGPKALVHVPSEACPECGGDTERISSDQLPLLRHGGYGAAERSVRVSCRCGWTMVAEVSEVKP